MASMPYNFKGKPMEPYDKRPRGNGLFIAIGIVVVLFLLLLAGAGVWFMVRHFKSSVQTDETVTKAAVELPEAKVVETPPKAIAAKPVAPPKPANPQEAAKFFDSATKLFAASKFANCREDCWKALELLGEDDPLWGKVADLLGKASMTIFTSDIRAPEKILHHVKAGDSLLKIAMDNDTTMEAIRKSSGMEPDDNVIRPGQTLSVYKGEWSLKVSKSRYKLYVYDHDRLFKVYTVGIGRQDRTPAGTFELGVKQRNPDWYSKGRKYPYGSPENILGTRWMALAPTGSTNKDLKGYGIHGTNDPANVGKSASNGCVRMRNEEVDELFAITPMKTPVEIIE